MTGKDKLPVLASLPQPCALQETLTTVPTASAPSRPVATTAQRDAAQVGRAGAAAPADACPAPVQQGLTEGPTQDRDHTSRRILALYFPHFAIERWRRDAARRGEALSGELPDDVPLALATDGPHGPVIHAVNRTAAQAGVQPGARVVDMRALCPGLRVEHADTGADRAALGRLMLWMRRWCPWSAIDGTAGLVPDSSGAAHLWGGEAAMLRDIEGQLAVLGLTARGAIAPTHGAAWALARMGAQREICAPEALGARIAPLPVRALRLDADTVLMLQRLGLKTVGDLAAVPRISLARRFSRAALAQNPLLRLDQMTGRLAEPINSPDDPPRFAVQSRLAEPVQDPTPHLPALCAALCETLAVAGFGARRITLTVYRSDGEVSQVSAATSQPTRDPTHLCRLFDGRIEKIDPGFGFDLITLAASVAEALATQQSRLDAPAGDGTGIARMMDRFGARFGTQALRAPTLQDSHIPERREAWIAAMETSGAQAPAAEQTRPLPARHVRPLRLFSPPEEVRVIYAVPEGPPAQFIWRRVTHRVTRFAGPERIAPEWWHAPPGARLRDYYRIEDQTGQRYWIFREGIDGDGRGAHPRWFVQGSFA